MDLDGWPDLLVGANRYSSTPTASEGAGYLAYAPFSGTVSLEEGGAMFVGGTDASVTGRSVRGLEDLDADGFPDVGIGSPNAEVDGVGTGAVYLFRGGPR